MKQATTLLVLAATLAIGCNADDHQRVVEHDVGELCVFAEEPTLQTPLSHTLDFRVNSEDCGGSCAHRDLVFTCEASVDGSTITVTSEYSYVELDRECAARCDKHNIAVCSLSGLADGDYPIHFAGDTYLIFNLPSSTTDCYR